MVSELDSRFTIAEAKVREHASWFDKAFVSYFDSLQATQELPRSFSYPQECLAALRELALAGGKRQRVAFFLEASRLVDGVIPGDAERVALSIELLQAHLLIHDDIIDNSPTRRGVQSTLYRFLTRMGGDHARALGLALLTGDIASSLAMDILTGLPRSEDLVGAQLRAHILTCFGQAADLERDERPRTSDALDEVSDFKATRSSAFAPIELGLLLAGADSNDFGATVLKYSRLFGISGQMRDDYLSLFGTASVTGKSNDADIRDGRLTYVLALTLERADARQRALLEYTLGRQDATSEDIARLREVVTETGAADTIARQSIEYAELAAAEASTWRGRWDDDAVAFFEVVPIWGARRML
ncbi:polyprenyl synthetase family protein [Nonomuraea sp. NPDC049129]|uniref:polyprenyl synthetase family protein n=1 Tax=Nonomuraea sp. NPDC049129 TaxID=3155272 RepID=UPI0033D7D051